MSAELRSFLTGTIPFDVLLNASGPKLTTVTATARGATDASYGVANTWWSSPVIRDSRLEGSTAAIDTEPGSSAQVAHSILAGGASGEGEHTCFSVCNEDLVALATDCEPAS